MIKIHWQSVWQYRAGLVEVILAPHKSHWQMVLTADMTPICLHTENSVIKDKNHVKVYLSEFQKTFALTTRKSSLWEQKKGFPKSMTFHHTKNAYSCALFHFDFFGASNNIVIIRFKNHIEPWSFYFLHLIFKGH